MDADPGRSCGPRLLTRSSKPSPLTVNELMTRDTRAERPAVVILGRLRGRLANVFGQPRCRRRGRQRSAGRAGSPGEGGLAWRGRAGLRGKASDHLGLGVTLTQQSGPGGHGRQHPQAADG